MKILRRTLFICLAAAGASSLADEATHPALYSFADVYRLTVNAAPEALALVPAAQAPQMHLASAMQDSFVAEPRFTISPVPGSQSWMLLLAGLAACGWVAHRRLTSAY